MAYTVTLYNFTKKVNSTKRPSGGTNYSCELKHGYTIENPVLVIKGVAFSTICNRNYMKFEDYYYFIDDIKSVRNQLVEITGTLDVLATYKSEIGNYECVISRCNNASHYNLYDIDNIYNPNNYVIACFEETVTTPFSYEVGSSFTMSYYGKSGAKAVNVGSISRLSNMFNSSDFWDMVNQNIFNPSQYVANLVHLPVTFSDYTAGATVQLGNSQSFNIDVAYPIDYGVNYSWYDSYEIDLTTLRTNMNYLTDYRSIDDRFTDVTMWIPFVGLIKITSSIFSHLTKIHIDYSIDMVTGQGECVVRSDLNGSDTNKKDYILHKANINVGATVPLGVSDSAWSSVLSNILNPVETVKTVLQGFNPRTNTNMVGTCNSTAYHDIDNIRLKVVQYDCDPIADYRETKGVPTNKKLLIKNVYGENDTGYIEVLNPSIATNGKTGTNEKINSYLESGFYYE